MRIVSGNKTLQKKFLAVVITSLMVVLLC